MSRARILANWVGRVGIRPAADSLRQGISLLDVVQLGIELAERDPNMPHVGVGGAPNMLGEAEFDAAIMDGDTLRVGAVAGLKGFVSAVSVARQVFESLPHTLLVGEGAARFAAECGAERLSDLPEKVKREYREWFEKRVPEHVRSQWPNVPLAPYTWPASAEARARDTVVMLAFGQNGSLAGGTSSSGWDYKYPGRVGDSPIIGSGLYVDSREGGCACTHSGETSMRTNTARSVVCYMKKGATVQEACHEAVDDLRRIRGGFAGPLVIHALSRDGEPYVVMTAKLDVTYCLWTEELDEIAFPKPVLDEVEFFPRG